MNILNFEHRWNERLALLLADISALRPDVLALQEVVYPMEQDRLLGAASDYAVFRGWDENPDTGNSILIRDGLRVDDPSRIDLGHGCAANRVTVTTEGQQLDVATTHLYYSDDADETRVAQIERLLEWLAMSRVESQIVMGDFNADPLEPAYARMETAAFRSAALEAHGVEPTVTYPTPLLRGQADEPATPACVDYIWVRGGLRVSAARLAFDRPAAGDGLLYPSDHYGLMADLELEMEPDLSV